MNLGITNPQQAKSLQELGKALVDFLAEAQKKYDLSVQDVNGCFVGVAIGLALEGGTADQVCNLVRAIEKAKEEHGSH